MQYVGMCFPVCYVHDHLEWSVNFFQLVSMHMMEGLYAFSNDHLQAK